jgi:hypothetical protein
MKTAKTAWLLCFGAGVTCAALNWLLLRRALWMAPDSWDFWQASVSLLDGRGYRVFVNDAPIKEWPPLYSLYLAAWQALFGVSGKALIWAQAALAGASALGWTRLALTLTVRARLDRTREHVANCAQALFITVFIATRYDCVRADNLKYVVLPALIAVCERARQSATRAQLLGCCVTTGALGALLMLTHNGSVAFLSAALLLVLLARQHSLGARLLGAALSTLLALIPWLISRSLFEQYGSHRVGFGVAAYDSRSYIVQAIGGSTTLLIAQPWLAGPLAGVLGGVTWCVFERNAFSARARVAIEARLMFAVAALCTLLGLFNVTYITDKLTGRFLFFVPLTLVPLCIALLASGKRAALCYGVTALAVLTLLPRLLDVSGGVQSSRAGRVALPEQIAHATDCVRRPDALPTWPCSVGTTPRLPPPDPDWSRL